MTREARGFTLIELMIVVTIVAVLAVVAGTAYRRYMDAARTTEAYSMLGEIRAKEEAYRAEKSQYVYWASDETPTSAFPVVDDVGCKEPCYKDVDPSKVTPPPGWTALGINPGRTRLQCGYLALTGQAGAAPTAPLGQEFFDNKAPQTPWWYAVAICDNDGNAAKNATFTTGFNTTVVSAQNEHQ